MNNSNIMLLSYDHLKNWCAAALKHSGMDDYETECIIDCLLSSNLRGVDSHGVNLIQFYADRYRVNPHRDITVTTETAATCIVDGGDHSGPAVGCFALEKAIEKAKATGIGMAVAVSSGHFGAAGFYSLRAAERGYIGFTTTTAMATLAPWGGLETFVGNNPFAISFPTAKMPIVLDIANSVVARQRITTYAREGKVLPEGWALDSSGKPTTDPNEALKGFLMPIGGHKGVGIAIMLDMLVAILGQSGLSRDICSNIEIEKAQNTAHAFIVIDPKAFLPGDTMDALTEKYIADYKAVPPMDGVKEVMLPGEIEFNRQQERMANGLPITIPVIRELNAFAARNGLQPLADVD